MKDKYGGIKIGSTVYISRTELEMGKHAESIKKHNELRLAHRLGEEVVKSFPPKTHEPPEMDATVLETYVVVISAKDYAKLTELAWRYEELE